MRRSMKQTWRVDLEGAPGCVLAGLCLALGLLVSTSAAPAHAQSAEPVAAEPLDTAPSRSPKRFAARGSFGLGGGGDGIGARLAGSATVWPSDFIGASIELQNAGDGALFGPSEDFLVLSAGPSFRSSTGRFYGQLDLLFGGGRGEATVGQVSLFSPTPKRSLSGLAVSVVASAYWHPAVLELGPTIEVSVYDGASVATLGFAIGCAL
jgi:hypothetical protein